MWKAKAAPGGNISNARARTWRLWWVSPRGPDFGPIASSDKINGSYEPLGESAEYFPARSALRKNVGSFE